ncbi:MAG: hypothetical protein KF708_18525 [Pirellulales bacterium]|nr:hypothetical protein [Pirellulales bacterium]
MLGLLVPLVLGELVVRVVRGRVFSLASPRRELITLLNSSQAHQYHPRLGWLPTPNTKVDHRWNVPAQVTIDAFGLRSNGGFKDFSETRPIVAVGDSFTFCEFVSDDETWPAYLERALRRPVVNAGVDGYGFDQTVLRAEELVLAPTTNPECLVVSLIPDNVRRCKMAYRFAWKPYFYLESSGLQLRNVPVPRSHLDDGMGALWETIGYSHLLDAVFLRAAPGVYLSEAGWAVECPENDGIPPSHIAALLVDRLSELQDKTHVPILLVLQPEFAYRSGNEQLVEPLIDRAPQRGIRVLNLITAVHAMSPDESAPLFFPDWFGHMTPAGNRWVAEQIAEALKREFGIRP